MATRSRNHSHVCGHERRPRKKTRTMASETREIHRERSQVFEAAGCRRLSPRTRDLTPEQAFELYRANARLALEVIDAAIESTAKMRKLQFEGEETARTIQRKAARHAAEAGDVPTLMAAGQSVTQEALERSMAYWGQMFELVVEIQKRLFTLMEDQMAGVPGVKQAKAAMAMMPDMTKMQNVISAMQGVMSSGGSAFESMQKVMGDFARMSGVKR